MLQYNHCYGHCCSFLIMAQGHSPYQKKSFHGNPIGFQNYCASEHYLSLPVPRNQIYYIIQALLTLLTHSKLYRSWIYFNYHYTRLFWLHWFFFCLRSLLHRFPNSLIYVFCSTLCQTVVLQEMAYYSNVYIDLKCPQQLYENGCHMHIICSLAYMLVVRACLLYDSSWWSMSSIWSVSRIFMKKK